jgi:hypothetical protein
MTHKERIKSNIDKFDSGKWNKFTYAHDFECCINWVGIILNEVLLERLNAHRWELQAAGLALDHHYFINDPEVEEIQPKSVHNLPNNKIQVIYQSKMNNYEQ